MLIMIIRMIMMMAACRDRIVGTDDCGNSNENVQRSWIIVQGDDGCYSKSTIAMMMKLTMIMMMMMMVVVVVHPG